MRIASVASTEANPVSSAFPGESGSLVRLQSRDACALDDACPAVHAQLIKQPL